MRRWFQVYRDSEGAWFAEASDAGGDGDILFVSMPHKQKLCDVFNSSKDVKFALVTGPGDMSTCDGNNDTNGHLYHPKDGTSLLFANAIDLQDQWIQGFFDKNQSRNQIFKFDFSPPDEFGG